MGRKKTQTQHTSGSEDSGGDAGGGDAPRLVAAIDQGTSSTRCSVWNEDGECIASHQIELDAHYPASGWMEQDPLEILEQVHTCINKVCDVLKGKGYEPSSIKVIGITNQRETTVVWDKGTGQPLHNAIVWQDTRTAPTVERLINDTPTQDMNYFQKKCGLPFSTYFSALKLRWMLDNIPLVREEVAAGRCMCGTIDSWLIWNLTGGLRGGVHVTDVTNASRTMLMNVNTLQWDTDICKSVPAAELDAWKCAWEALPSFSSISDRYRSLRQ
ncbi:hypothetical protein PTSG_09443 [Salpingoeca rosetta]|uniref:glycerol kinase n=1 Tax=Salpingoeca rosetta (strain ATCC 50818 / BSB-021) TaxID=946362 RepID=F2UMM7_SALR5|nr:uncharacterized protein PTSG_09443 [Salpingoeca rosetta]EGD78376.1 hypothetical protein PTSG_09443 [Salpingoeca rosetta]|eukprot:XP_004989699.1 hypothetical protein PTSG_09443 [Salpingoeca rosetta]